MIPTAQRLCGLALLGLSLAACGARLGAPTIERDASPPADLGAPLRLWCDRGDTIFCCGCPGAPDPTAPICSNGCWRGRFYCTHGNDAFDEVVPCPDALVLDASPPDGFITDAAACEVGDASCTTAPGPDQACVGGGLFLRGSDELAASMPQQRIAVSSFWMDRRKVTVARYRECVASGDCMVPSQAPARAYYEDPAHREWPMHGVELMQMSRYCQAHGGRLPTESEWERAARGATGRTYPWGEQVGCEYANWAGCHDGIGPVGAFPAGASPEGILDLIGDLAELTIDEWLVGGYSGYLSDGLCNPTRPWRYMSLIPSVVRGCGPSRRDDDPDGTASMRACTGFARAAGPTTLGATDGVSFRCVRNGH